MQLAFQESRREARHKVLLRARMRAGATPVDICIRDVSGLGLLVQAAAPPCTGSYVEIVHGRYSVVGRVRWAGERRFGILASHRIDVEALLSETQRPNGNSSCRLSVQPIGGAAARSVAGGQHDHDRARYSSRAMQFLAFLLIGSVATAGVAGIVYESMGDSMSRISAALQR